jgi:hypothetical protein
LNYLETHGPTIVICSVVFGTVSFINASMTRDSNPNASVISKGPRPKWEVLRVMNYIVLATFIGSISYATINYHSTFAQGATPTFLAMAILWCLCLGYFFGFFGISFLDQETLQRSPSSLGLSEVSQSSRSLSLSLSFDLLPCLHLTDISCSPLLCLVSLDVSLSQG